MPTTHRISRPDGDDIMDVDPVGARMIRRPDGRVKDEPWPWDR
jgi:hypothetical protein